MPPYDKMYSRLFNAITDALPLIQCDPQLAQHILRQAQQETEDLYITEEN